MKVLVTGANGYLGGLIIEFLKQHQIEYSKLVRNPQDEHSVYFKLGEEIDDKIFKNADVLIHVAHDFSAVKWEDNYQVNVIGAARLFEHAKMAGVKKIIFISSMSSFLNCKSKYGQSKYQIEQELADFANGYIVRPGLIYGPGNSGGMVGALSKVTKLRVLPLIHTNSKLYLCYYPDLLILIHNLILNDILSCRGKPIIAANPTPYTFKQILQFLGAKLLLPIPWQPVWLLLKTLEICGLNLRTGSDNLISLINQDPNPDFSMINSLNIKFKKFGN